jgi:hypothetical protein
MKWSNTHELKFQGERREKMEWKDKRFLFFWHREPKTGPLHAQVLYY